MRPQWDGWQRRVAKALKDERVRNGIAMAIRRYAKAHIAKSEGRGQDGRTAQLAPLQPVSGEFWTKRKPREGTFPKATRERTVAVTTKRKDGSIKVTQRKVTEYLMAGESYRNGGQPLRDTGKLQASITARATLAGPTRVEVTLAGALYGIFHEFGFTTSGPNFIPLTFKGKRKHAKKANPNAEGLTEGKDYLMAWEGVTVPKRPFLVPTNKEWEEIGRTIRLGIARVLKGRT